MILPSDTSIVPIYKTRVQNEKFFAISFPDIVKENIYNITGTTQNRFGGHSVDNIDQPTPLVSAMVFSFPFSCLPSSSSHLPPLVNRTGHQFPPLFLFLYFVSPFIFFLPSSPLIPRSSFSRLLYNSFISLFHVYIHYIYSVTKTPLHI